MGCCIISNFRVAQYFILLLLCKSTHTLGSLTFMYASLRVNMLNTKIISVVILTLFLQVTLEYMVDSVPVWIENLSMCLRNITLHRWMWEFGLILQPFWLQVVSWALVGPWGRETLDREGQEWQLPGAWEPEPSWRLCPFCTHWGRQDGH